MAEEKPKLGLSTASLMVCANMIGTGVFTSLGFQLDRLPSGFSILVLWFLGGVISLCGALVYSEVASVIPHSGGESVYLRELFGPSLGFLAGWVSLIAGFAAPIAASAHAFAIHLSPWTHELGVSPNVAALSLVALLTCLHLLGTRKSGAVQNLLSALKITLLGVVILVGFFHAKEFPSIQPRWGDVQTFFSEPFAVSFVFVLYAYTGWNAAVYIANDLSNPQKTLPRALLIGTVSVTLIYLLLQASFLLSTPTHLLTNKPNVAQAMMNHVFGPRAGLWISGLVAIGLMSAVSAMIWGGSNVLQANIPGLGASNRWGRPHRSLLLQLGLVAGLLLSTSFETLIYFIGFLLTLCSALTVTGIFLIRYRKNQSAFRCPGHPWPALIFLAVSLASLAHLAFAEPRVIFAGTLFLLLGWLLYKTRFQRALALVLLLVLPISLSAQEIDASNSSEECLMPFTQMLFPTEMALNDLQNVNEEYKRRYLVADLNTLEIDGSQKCRGMDEVLPEDSDIPELSNPVWFKNYQDRVQKFRPKQALSKAPVITYAGKKWCIGQRLIACELVPNGGKFSAVRVARFLTSSKAMYSTKKYMGILEYEKRFQTSYYAPINQIHQRGWSSDRPYGQVDQDRDRIMGGSKGSRVTHFRSPSEKGVVLMEMPNFLYFKGLPGYSYVDGNGIHEKMAAEGSELKDFLGAPISLGCIRLTDYAAKFLRWYIPMGAKFFIHYQTQFYSSFPPSP